jgi:hypothetical protein
MELYLIKSYHFFVLILRSRPSSVLILSDVMSIVFMLCVYLQNVVIWNGIMLTVTIPRPSIVKTECHYAECNYTKCYYIK